MTTYDEIADDAAKLADKIAAAQKQALKEVEDTEKVAQNIQMSARFQQQLVEEKLQAKRLEAAKFATLAAPTPDPAPATDTPAPTPSPDDATATDTPAPADATDTPTTTPEPKWRKAWNVLKG